MKRLTSRTFLIVLAFFVSFLKIFSQTTVTLINPTTDGGFELGSTPAANGWTATTGTATQAQWVVNTATFFQGTRSAYVTNNTAGVPPPNAYTTTTIRVTHLYRNFSIPTGASSATLSFYFKGIGEAGFDYMRVYFEPATNAAPLYGTQKILGGTSPTGIINAATN
ncbi:MAG: hypothetical protein ACK452_09765, partial [Bacteroidota bacterium]